MSVDDRLVLTDAAEFDGSLSGLAVNDKLDFDQFQAVLLLSFAENTGHAVETLTIADNS